MTASIQLPENHSQRYRLHNEVHARAPLILNLPVRASHLALLHSQDEKSQERGHLITLCERFGAKAPEKDADHFSAHFGSFQIRWEQHGEFSTYSFYVHDTTKDPFGDCALKKVPTDWLAQLTGQVIVAAHTTVVNATDIHQNERCDLEQLSAHFDGNAIIGSKVTGEAASVFTDFRIHADGFSRFLIVSHDLRSEQVGRLLLRPAPFKGFRHNLFEEDDRCLSHAINGSHHTDDNVRRNG